jgi:hypothetical protein
MRDDKGGLLYSLPSGLHREMTCSVLAQLPHQGSTFFVRQHGNNGLFTHSPTSLA